MQKLSPIKSTYRTELLHTFVHQFTNQKEEEQKNSMRQQAVNDFRKALIPFFEKLAEKCPNKIYTEISVKFALPNFGSTLFNGTDMTSDIDLMLGTYEDLLDRKGFFGEFSDFLESSEIGAKNLQKIPQAKIPIIKFEYKNVQFDMLFCFMKAPSKDIINDQQAQANYFFQVQNCVKEVTNIKSFRGWSNCQVMYDMIKDKEVFSWALKIIKYWTKVRGIYGFNFGYLNGISLIIMLVRVLKELQSDDNDVPFKENATAACSKNTSLRNISDDQLLEINDKVTELVTYFFQVYSKWDYSNAIYAQDDLEWCYDMDLYSEIEGQPIKIVTPEGPYKCTTQYTTESSLGRIVKELKRAHNISLIVQNKEKIADLSKQVYQKQNPMNRGSNNDPKIDNKVINIMLDITWAELFTSSNFFKNHEVFLQIKTLSVARNIEKQSNPEIEDVSWRQHKEFKGLLESRLKILQSGLEEELCLKNIQIFTESIDSDNLIEFNKKLNHQSYYYIGFPFKAPELTIDRKNAILGCICNWLLKKVYEVPLPHIDNHKVHMNFVTFEDLPPCTLQRSLALTYKSPEAAPTVYIRKKISWVDLYHQAKDDPNVKKYIKRY